MKLKTMKFLAPAKLNLFLEVTGRRDDGYHTIETVFQTVSLYDTITIEPHVKVIQLHCDAPGIPCDERNLALRAALLLKEKTSYKKGAIIKLEKGIPAGAGLGGGSSDAAAVLKCLIKLWDIKISPQDLLEIAVSLGADVPFFLHGGTAVAQGIGEQIKPLSGVAPAHYLLIYPGFQVSTAGVYGKLQFPLTKKQKINKILNVLVSGSQSELWSRLMFNRLEDAVFPEHRMVRHAKDMLTKLGYPSLMSGSGSTVFAVIPSPEDGEKIMEKLKKYPWRFYTVTTLSL